VKLSAAVFLAGCPEGGFSECVRGEADCPAPSCAERDNDDPSTWLADGFEAWCDADWTLAAVVSDDGQETWTWNNRALWTEPADPIGDLSLRHRDLRTPAFDLTRAHLIRFVHQPSGVDAVYELPSEGPLSGVLNSSLPGCFGNGPGLPLVGGGLELDVDLCNTDLYLHPLDQDGSGACDSPPEASSNAWGPAWSAGGNDGCPLDDPGEFGGLGPSSVGDPDVEFGFPPDGVSRGLGFGAPLALNTGRVGSGENRIEIYVMP